MQLSLRTFLLAIGGVLIVTHHFFPVPSDIQIVFLFIILFTLGIPHGALDFFIDRGTADMQNSIRLPQFLLRYLINMIVYALVWYFIPVVGFLIFLLLTAYHFGEIDWMGKVASFRHRTLYFFLGLNWILFILSVHAEEAIEIFVLMGRSSWDAASFRRLSAIVLPISFTSLWILHGFLLVFYRQLYNSSKDFIFSVLQILLLALINVTLPLWLCFAFYFGVWHSILSFDLIRRDLDLENSFAGWKELIKKALPYAFIAWMGILLFIIFQSDTSNLTDVLHLLFVGIAVLTLPHLLVFTKLKMKV